MTSSEPLYPFDYFRVSPTFNTWAKLTAADVYALRVERGFEGQHVYFALNHPIRFVCVVGPIVAIEDINHKFTILTLDDGSGAAIDLKIRRLPAELANAVDCPSNTAVSNLNVISTVGHFDVSIDAHIVQVGTVLRARGTISEFRGARQLELLKVSLIRSTQEEARAWEKLGKFQRDVLAKPWLLSQAEVDDLERELSKDRRREEERKQLRAAAVARRAERHRRNNSRTENNERKMEKRRRADEVRLNGSPLI